MLPSNYTLQTTLFGRSEGEEAADPSQTQVESEWNLELLLDAAPIPLALTRASDHIVIYGNRRAAALFEIAPEDIPGQCAAEYWVDRGKREWFLTALLSNGRVDDLEVRLRSSNGRVFWARISAQVVRFRGELCLLGGMYDISERKRAEEALRALAATDGLTGAYNRGHFSSLGAAELKRAMRYGHLTSLAILDIDHFKRINDELGHAAGDVVLRQLVAIIGKEVRSTDIVGRIGGEEFALLFPETALRAAEATAERVRRATRAQSLACHGLPPDRRITVSVGVAQLRAGETLDGLMKRADEGLYEAKRGGRDRVVLVGDAVQGLSP